MKFQVDAKWVEDSLQPGEVGTLQIKTGQGSLCSISFVDTASTFSRSSNRINFDRVLHRFPRYLYNNLNCNQTKNETIKAAGTTPRKYHANIFGMTYIYQTKDCCILIHVT